jgi:hypothetical protein
MRANKPLLHGDITASIIDSFWQKARFYRAFFENRFKQRNQRCP